MRCLAQSHGRVQEASRERPKGSEPAAGVLV